MARRHNSECSQGRKRGYSEECLAASRNIAAQGSFAAQHNLAAQWISTVQCNLAAQDNLVAQHQSPAHLVSMIQQYRHQKSIIPPAPSFIVPIQRVEPYEGIETQTPVVLISIRTRRQ